MEVSGQLQAPVALPPAPMGHKAHLGTKAKRKKNPIITPVENGAPIV